MAEGRFELTGGWFLEPDCLLPHGESFVRQALYSQRYLKKTFGKICRIGSNVDSFGHSCTLPQILQKSGMDLSLIHIFLCHCFLQHDFAASHASEKGEKITHGIYTEKGFPGGKDEASQLSLIHI